MKAGRGSSRKARMCCAGKLQTPLSQKGSQLRQFDCHFCTEFLILSETCDHIFCRPKKASYTAFILHLSTLLSTEAFSDRRSHTTRLITNCPKNAQQTFTNSELQCLQKAVPSHEIGCPCLKEDSESRCNKCRGLQVRSAWQVFPDVWKPSH